MNKIQRELAKINMEQVELDPFYSKFTDEQLIKNETLYGAKSLQKSGGFEVGDRILVSEDVLRNLDSDYIEKYTGQTARIFGITQKNTRRLRFHLRFDDASVIVSIFNEYFKKIKQVK